MAKNIVFVWILFLSLFCLFITPSVASPRWTVEASGGLYYPEDDSWSSFYGNNKMLEGSVSFARRILWVLDLGIAVSYGKDKGKGFLKSSGTKLGIVTHEMLPVDVFAVFRARFAEGQWIVPYIGGGYTHFLYRRVIEDEGKSKGAISGQHVRAGLQFLLDPLDRDSANTLLKNYGVINSYFYIEGKQTTADEDSTGSAMGGLSYKAGIMLEY